MHASLTARALKALAPLAILTAVAGLLLACGESEGIGNGGGAPQTTATPTSEPATPTSEPATATPTAQQPAPPSPTTTPDRIDHPIGKDEMIVRITTEGGLAPPSHLLTRTPIFVLDGRGCVITHGPMIMIYPPPALPNLLETCLQEEGVQYILEAAREAGLLEGDAHYPMDMLADGTTTVFEINAGGASIRVSAYALAEGSDEFLSGDDIEAQIAAREKLREFQSRVFNLESWLPPNVFVSVEEPYEIERMQLVFLPSDSPWAPRPEAGMGQQEIEWPLAGGLAGFGEPYSVGYRCGVVEGDELATLMERLRDANQLTLWTSDGASYYLFPRPLIAGEEGCARA